VLVPNPPQNKYFVSCLYLLFESVLDFCKVFKSKIFCNKFIVRYV
jgi:hypothetical protein